MKQNFNNSKMIDLQKAISHPLWLSHRIGDLYQTKGNSGEWKIAYYPIFQNGKTGEFYDEPRALMEKTIEGGIDFREMPLRYVTRTTIHA